MRVCVTNQEMRPNPENVNTVHNVDNPREFWAITPRLYVQHVHIQ